MYIFQTDLVGIFLLMISFSSVISRKLEASALLEKSSAEHSVSAKVAASVKSSHQTTQPPPFSVVPKLPESSSSTAQTTQNLSSPVLGGSLSSLGKLLKLKKLRKIAKSLHLRGHHHPHPHPHHPHLHPHPHPHHPHLHSHDHPHHHPHHHSHHHSHHHDPHHSPHHHHHAANHHHHSNGEHVSPVNKPLSRDSNIHARSQTHNQPHHIHNEFQLPDLPDAGPYQDGSSSEESGNRKPMTKGQQDIHAH